MPAFIRNGTFALWSSALSWGALGVIYAINAPFMYGIYGIPLTNINELNMVRGVYGGCFIGIASLWVLGAMNERYREAALLTLFVCMAGFTFGRTLSVFVDGTPTWHMFMWIGFEISGAVFAAYALSQRHTLSHA